MKKYNALGQPICKFCGLPEGAPGRNNNKPVHINAHGLCGPCYTLLEKVKNNITELTFDERDWFREMCDFNYKHGMFVPIVQRRGLQRKYGRIKKSD